MSRRFSFLAPLILLASAFTQTIVGPLAIQNPAPSGLSASYSPTGGSLAPSASGALTRCYAVTGIDASGNESALSPEQCLTQKNVATGQVVLSWNAPSVYSSYRIHRGFSSGSYGGYMTSSSSPFTDDGTKTVTLESGVPGRGNSFAVKIDTGGFSCASGVNCGSGSGTVTSVALSVPSILSIAGSPVTTSGTLAITLASESANTVLAGATSGGSATPAFRALVGADLPAPAPTTAGGVRSKDCTGTGHVLSINTDSTVTCSADGGGGGGSGTVTSVAATVPPWLTVAGSPITTSGTLAITAASGQTQNQVIASPDGSSGAVALRALVAADLPSIPESKLSITDVTTGNVSTSAHGFAPKGDANAAHYLDGTGAYSTPAGGGGGTPCTTTALSIQFNNAGAFGCVSNITVASNQLVLENNTYITQKNASGTASNLIGMDSSNVVKFGNNVLSLEIDAGVTVQILAQKIELDPQNIALLYGYSFDNINQYDGLNIGTNFTSAQTRMMTFKQNITGGHSQLAIVAGPGDASGDTVFEICLTGDNACATPQLAISRNGLALNYNGAALAGSGLAAVYAAPSASRTSTLSDINLQVGGAIAPAGKYRVHVYLVVTTGGASATLVPHVKWTDIGAARDIAGSSLDASTTNFLDYEQYVLADGVNNIKFGVVQTNSATWTYNTTLERVD